MNQFHVNDVPKAFEDYQKLATKSFFIDLMTLLEEYQLTGISLQYSSHSPNSFTLVRGAYLLDEIYHNDNFDSLFSDIHAMYQEHLPYIMIYVQQTHKLNDNCYEFDFDIKDFFHSALQFCGKDLLEEIEAIKLNQNLTASKKSNTLKV